MALLLTGVLLSFSQTSAEVGVEDTTINSDYSIEVEVVPESEQQQSLIISSPFRSPIRVNNSRFDNGGIERYFSLLAKYISPEKFGSVVGLSEDFIDFQSHTFEDDNVVLSVIDKIIVSSVYGTLFETNDLKEISTRQALLEAAVTKKQITAVCVADGYKVELKLSTSDKGHCDVSKRSLLDESSSSVSLLDSPVKHEEVVCLDVFDSTLLNLQEKLSEQEAGGSCSVTESNI